MNIKSLLLGSAAVLVAASTAQAADAIIVEPEPVEYVRICDAYGNGFFYIPGTETCLKFSGYVRSTYTHGDVTVGGIDTNVDHASWTYRGRLNIDARNETEWGTLRSQLRLQGGSATAVTDAPVGVDRALISLAGFRLGYSDTYWTTNGVGSLGYGITSAIADGPYGYDQGLFFDYTFQADGFTLTVGVQDSTGSFADMETPDYYVGATYSADWGAFGAQYLYDQNAVNVLGVADGAGAWKLSLALTNIGDTGVNFGAWYMADGDDDTMYVTGHSGAVAAIAGWTDSVWGVTVEGKIADNLLAYAIYNASDSDNSVAAVAAGYEDSHGYTIGLKWDIATGLYVKTEYTAYENDFVGSAADVDVDAFIVRFVRSW